MYRVHAEEDIIGVVRFYGATYEEGTAVIMLEYMNRGSLLSVIDHYGKISEVYLRPIAKQILLGLCWLHKNRQLHRDLKVMRHSDDIGSNFH
jgi:serine/threonine protein kinase